MRLTMSVFEKEVFVCSVSVSSTQRPTTTTNTRMNCVRAARLSSS